MVTYDDSRSQVPGSYTNLHDPRREPMDESDVLIEDRYSLVGLLSELLS